ncbi:MAG: dolichol-phosphate mannosyltransferase [Gaiellales bacterium]|nr:dolichol-phosphate mannosyltransferase [Gaiellales bacterium]
MHVACAPRPLPGSLAHHSQAATPQAASATRRSTVLSDRSSIGAGHSRPRSHPGVVTTNPLTVAVVPTYNEAATLDRFVADFEREAPGIDLLFVDDASPDGTGALADRMAATRPWLHVLHRPRKDGLGNAYRAGFGWALARDYAAVAQLDADLSHPPALVPRMLEALARGADVVLGSRYAPGGGSDGWPLHRRIASRVGCAASARALGLPYSDLSGGLKLWRATALTAIDVSSTGSQGYVFQVETTQRAHRAGLRVVELPFTFRDRTAGESKMKPGIALEGVRMVARLRRDGWRPQRVASAARTGA